MGALRQEMLPYGCFSLDRARASGCLCQEVWILAQCLGVFFSPPSFPEPWHWGVWNGSTCCNQTCELLLVAKILQQPLH